MASFGAQLKQERERQKISLDDISLTTKISTRMLRALEEERFDQLPGGIFNKGFIRAYARCLGMDEDQAIADYLATTTVSPSGKKSEYDDQPPALDPYSREESTASDGLPWGTLAVLLLIVALGFAAWGFYSRESQKGTPASVTPASPPPAVSPARVAEPAPAANAPETPTAAVVMPSQPTVPSPAGNQSASTPAANPPVPPATNPPVATPSQSSPPDLQPGGFVVLIKAREDSWLSVAIDGEVRTQGTLTAPAEKAVRATREITIRAGNIGALDFAFNGKPLPAQGGYGEVKTLTFDAKGLRPPAPKPPEPAQLPSPAQDTAKEP